MHVEILAHAGQVDQRLRHRASALDRGRGSGEREVVAAQRDPHAQPAGELEQIGVVQDRKSTRLNSSHLVISYAVFCLKKKKMTRKMWMCACATSLRDS